MGAGRLIQRPARGFEPGSPAWKAGILPPRQLAPQPADWPVPMVTLAVVWLNSAGEGTANSGKSSLFLISRLIPSYSSFWNGMDDFGMEGAT